MDKDKAQQEISVIGRLLSLEGLILVMGIASLVYGIVRKQPLSVFWGIIILGGFVALIFVRKRDWKKHWEELEQEKRRRDEGEKK